LGEDNRDANVVAALRAGDESAFVELYDRCYGPMLSVARRYVATREAAEDVVQEAFTALIEGIDRFEGRSSLKTWLFSILIFQAISRGKREHRSSPFSSLAVDDDRPVVDPSRFLRGDHRWAGFWASPPSRNYPEEQLLRGELRELLARVVSELPEQQALVLSLRDIEDLPAEEVCELLGITHGNQRVLLHRARARCRSTLERHADLVRETAR
jgi:RNA polymerase sigma-70 factor (ECF subfamily)